MEDEGPVNIQGKDQHFWRARFQSVQLKQQYPSERI